MFFMYSFVEIYLSLENRSPWACLLVLTSKAHGVLFGFSQLADTHAGWNREEPPVLGQLEVSACSGSMGTHSLCVAGTLVAECWPGLPESCSDLALLPRPHPHHEHVTVVMISPLIAQGLGPLSLYPSASPLAVPFPKLWPMFLSPVPPFAECLHGHGLGLIWTSHGCGR